MKSIKLFFIFTLVLGGVVAAFYYTTRLDPIPAIEFSPTPLQEYCEQFEKDWRTAGDWDEETFKSHCNVVNQLSAQDYDVVSLNDLNTSTAVEIVYEHIFNEWNTSSCRKQTIDYYMKAISTIENAEENASSNPNVKQIKKVNKVYVHARDLAHRQLGLTPEFNGHSWNSYSRYTSLIESQRDSILGDSIYQTYLSNISEISKELQEIPSRLSSGRTSFYQSLKNKIIAYYNKKSRSKRTRTDLGSLNRVIRKYENEYGEKSSPLRSFAHSYAKDVSENEM